MRLKSRHINWALAGLVLVLLLHSAWGFFNPDRARVKQWLSDAAQVQKDYQDIAAGKYKPTTPRPNPSESATGGNSLYLVDHPAIAYEIGKRAFLLTIQENESTNPNAMGVSPYRVLYDKNVWNGDFSKHPDPCAWIKSGAPCSWDEPAPPSSRTGVAGAYQFLITTWGLRLAQLREAGGDILYKDPVTGEPIGEFAPINQDIVATANFAITEDEGKGGYQWLNESISVTPVGLIAIDRAKFNHAAIAAAKEWASFALKDGTSIGSSEEMGSQKAHPSDVTWNRFLTHLEQQQIALIPGAAAALQAVSPAPAAATPVTNTSSSSSIPKEMLEAPNVGDQIAGWSVSDVIKIRTSNPETGLAISGCDPDNPTVPPCREHRGNDIATESGTALYAPVDGFVECIQDSGAAGLFAVFTLSSNPDAAFRLLHLSECNSGEYVVGDRFGATGTGGTGPHVHIEYWIGNSYYLYAKALIWGFLKGKLTSNSFTTT